MTKAARLAYQLGLDEADWHRAQDFVVGLLGLLRRQHVALSPLLSDRGAVTADEIDQTLEGGDATSEHTRRGRASTRQDSAMLRLLV